jgi:hypothetical protein
MMTAVAVIVSDLLHKKLCISTRQNRKCGAAIHPSSSISTTNQQMTTTRVTVIHQAVLVEISNEDREMCMINKVSFKNVSCFIGTPVPVFAIDEQMLYSYFALCCGLSFSFMMLGQVPRIIERMPSVLYESTLLINYETMTTTLGRLGGEMHNRLWKI